MTTMFKPSDNKLAAATAEIKKILDAANSDLLSDSVLKASALVGQEQKGHDNLIAYKQKIAITPAAGFAAGQSLKATVPLETYQHNHAVLGTASAKLVEMQKQLTATSVRSNTRS